MKKLFVLAMVMFFVCGALAQDRQLLKANVPFDFMAEDRSLPAGSYSVYLLNPHNMLLLQSLDHRASAIIRGFPAQKGTNGKAELVFDKIDGRFFLTEVREPDNPVERTLPLGKFARELQAKRHSGPPTDGVVAISAH